MLVVALACLVASAGALSAPVTPSTQKGDVVTNPANGDSVKVIGVYDTFVVTDDNYRIFLYADSAVGDILVPDDPATTSVDESVTVQSVTTDPGTGLVTQMTLFKSGEPPSVIEVAKKLNPAQCSPFPDCLAGGAGTSGGLVSFSPPTGNNPFNLVKRGGNGANGDDGWGEKICFGLLGCITIGESPSPGDPGKPGPALAGTVTDSNHGDITTIDDNVQGIRVASLGGDGGSGGDVASLGSQSGQPGGRAGAGGDVTVTSAVDITTLGDGAYGIFAKSAAGTGGPGGNGYIAAGSGGGGAPAQGGHVTVTNNGSILTKGDSAAGIYALSVGGSAGNAGDSWGIVGNAQSGSPGGNGGTAKVINNGTVETLGVASSAILAQSIGGSGGDGGDAGGISALGGQGSVGGNGGAVNVVNNATAKIVTHGDRSMGVLAQSIGGGGGNGGSASGISAIGASGDAGGDAGTVTVTNKAGSSIWTEGGGAHGVLAQSVGGGGGVGGNSSGLASIGGSGASGGVGETVTIESHADITTRGVHAHGLFAQSIGGGGGAGGMSNGNVVTIGGKGGKGGNANTVSVTNTGDIETAGVGADAIIVQSVGGGGGSGGMAAGGSAVAGVAIGGSGGNGGNGGAVTVTSKARTVTTGGKTVSVAPVIKTTSNRANGILAQSVGGGGGNGGAAIMATAGAGVSIAIAVGGSGGGGGNGDQVKLDGLAAVETAGDDSFGVLAQSVGGGGGNGGFSIAGALQINPYGGGAAMALGVGGAGGSGGKGGTVKLDLSGKVITHGARSGAVVAQSIGGGGGNGGFNVSGAISASSAGSAAVAIGVGGAGGSCSSKNHCAGGTVDATYQGTAITTGDSATAILLQSVGGGGGNGGFNVSGALSMSGKGSGAVAAGVGGFGGDGGNGGKVSGTITGDVRTYGVDSDAIIVQSLGGGGGNGGMNVSGTMSLSSANSGAVSLGLGGFGGGGGNASNASLTFTGNVVASGDDASAVTVQSIGGSGGNGGRNISAGLALSGKGTSFAAAIGVGGFGGGGGDAGAVNVAIHGNVATADSYGVAAQSIGGGGGNGGTNISAGVAIAKPGTGKSYALSLGVGGFGGNGGDAGAVDLLADGAIISTQGTGAFGVAAQSIGGGGGNGGINISGGLALDGSVTAGVGGFGGDGGLGGKVAVTTATDIKTVGDRAFGILAQSVGGGGGNGGINISGGITPQTNKGGASASVVFGVGGAGGTGNRSGDVVVAQTGDIETNGIDAYGILAQSIGGGGGNGALNVSASANNKSKFALSGGVGGHGGTGAHSGDVTVSGNGNISTLGAGISGKGILAQSIGGGGGNGGMNMTVAAIKTLSGGSLTLGVGGSGSGGGDAGDVSVTYGLGSSAAGLIWTAGDASAGIAAQSIGGGGGNAGADVVVQATTSKTTGKGKAKKKKNTLGLQLTVGGDAGAAGNGATTDVDYVGDIVTKGAGSEGILAQSIGGGGGNAAVNIGLVKHGGRSGNVTIGGAAGNGGDGGNVTVSHEGAITTYGNGAAGVFAQSIGGGGGDAAMKLDIPTGTPAGTVGVGGSVGGNLRLTLGRSGGTGGASNKVSLTSNGVVTTRGDYSVGLLAQSIGGGGGRSTSTYAAVKAFAPMAMQLALGRDGGSGGHGGGVSVTASGLIQTQGRGSHALFAQSVGGGGGFSRLVQGSPLSLQLRQGSTGASGKSGAVTVDNGAQLVTTGDVAYGIFAQSISGGGGASHLLVNPAPPGAGPTAIALGGTGTTGAQAATVTIINHGTIATQGSGSKGLVAQSIGGGGGLVEIHGADSNKTITLGGSKGTTGDGGDIHAQNKADIKTLGQSAYGVFLQSVGGGGGVVFTDHHKAPINLALNSGSTGDGGAITFKQDSNIVVEGDDAVGVFAQSVGGGGGVVNRQFAGTAGGKGKGGAVNLDIDGKLFAPGQGSTAIFVQSDGQQGSDIIVNIAAASKVVGGVGGRAVTIGGGHNNVITNHGLVGTMDGAEGIAFMTQPGTSVGNDEIVNFGTVVGSVQLGKGHNVFRNKVDAMLVTGTVVDLGAGGQLINNGVVQLGGNNHMRTVHLNGNLIQKPSGVIVADYGVKNPGDAVQTDRLTISGNAKLGGTVRIAFMNPGYIKPGTFSSVIVSATGGISGPGGGTPNFKLTQPKSAVTNFSLTYSKNKEVVLNTHVDFSPKTLNKNQHAVADYVSRVQNAGGSKRFAPVAKDIVTTGDVDTLKKKYNSMDPVVYAEALSSMLLANTHFNRGLRSCSIRQGGNGNADAGRCSWFQLGHQQRNRGATGAHIAYEQNGVFTSGGRQGEFSPGYHFAYGWSLNRAYSQTGAWTQTDTTLVQLGLMMQQDWGSAVVTQSLSAGHGWFNTERYIALQGNAGGKVNSDPNINYMTVRVGAGRRFQLDNWYVRPSGGVSLVGYRLGNLVEQGASGASAIVLSQQDTRVVFDSSVNIGGRFTLLSATVRPYANVGIRYFEGSSPQVSAQFSGAPASVEPFTVSSGMDQLFGNISLGLGMTLGANSQLHINVNSRFGHNTHTLSFGAKFNFGF